MPVFNSIQDVKAYIQTALNDTLQHEVADTATDAMEHAVSKTVYESYTPLKYQRRDVGGLGSPESVETTLEGDNVLFVTNTAKSSPSVIDGSVSDKLAEWVVYGSVPNIFNSNGNYPWMHPRDFISTAVDDLGWQGKLKDAVIAGMERHGFQPI